MRKPVPRYLATAEHLENQILAGRFGPRGRLPNEQKLAGEFGISLGTLRRSLDILERKNAVVRRQGSGTYVNSAFETSRRSRAPDNELRYFRFLNAETGTYLPVHSRVTAIERIRLDGYWSGHLGNEGDYVRLMRLLRVGDEFEIDSEIHFRARQVPGLMSNRPSDFDGVLIRDHVRRKFGLVTAYTEQSLCCTILPTAVCRRIGALIGTPGMRWDIVSRDERGAATSVQRAYVPQTDRQLVINDREPPAMRLQAG